MLKSLPAGVKAVDAITGEAVPMAAGKLSFPIKARELAHDRVHRSSRGVDMHAMILAG